jgi:predicted metal-dependent phosphotriesterase family hydrolase
MVFSSSNVLAYCETNTPMSGSTPEGTKMSGAAMAHLAEVSDLYMVAICHEDVLWLEVAVHLNSSTRRRDRVV